jgi:hypothetical protein
MTKEQRQRVLELLHGSSFTDGKEEREMLAAAPIPLDAAMEDRLVAAVLRQATPPAHPPEEGPLQVIPIRGTPARGAPMADAPATGRRSRSWKVAAWTAALAAAATVVLVLRTGPVAPPEELPRYALHVTGRAAVLGGDTAPTSPVVHLASGGLLQLDLRPSRAPADTVDVQPYLRQGERLMRWPMGLHRTDLGVFRLSVPVAAVPELQPGTWEILVVVGRAGRLPGDAEVSRVAGGGTIPAMADWQLLRQAVMVETP